MLNHYIADMRENGVQGKRTYEDFERPYWEYLVRPSRTLPRAALCALTASLRSGVCRARTRRV